MEISAVRLATLRPRRDAQGDAQAYRVIMTASGRQQEPGVTAAAGHQPAPPQRHHPSAFAMRHVACTTAG